MQKQVSRRPHSPIRLRRDAGVESLLKRRHYSWVCDDDRLAAAHFVDRVDPRRYAILHRSTKPGASRWQLSFFDERGAVSDFSVPKCQLALRELPHSNYRLREVASR